MRSIHQEDLITLSIYVHNKKTLKSIKQNLIELKIDIIDNTQ